VIRDNYDWEWRGLLHRVSAAFVRRHPVVYFEDFRRAAQYAFILIPTALRCAADIAFRRRGFTGAMPIATVLSPLARPPARKSGNTL
jgi:hypothetical protein